MLITISGPPGSGTTTAARRVADALDLELVFGGRMFRTMASERGMTLAEFGAYAAVNPSVDVELDKRLGDRARDGDAVIESRLAAWIVRQERLEALTVWLRCDERVRAERVAGREDVTVEDAMAENAEREKVEADRYLALYGIDIADLSVYNLILDTAALDASEVAAEIVTHTTST